MTSRVRNGLIWPVMTLAGLVLGAYVAVAWPEASPPAKSQQVRATASVDAYPDLGTVYLGDFFVYELGPTPLLDAVIAVPQSVDAN